MSIRLTATMMMLSLVFSAKVSAQLFRGALESAQLITADVGWATTDEHLFWTTNAGNEWTDITPPTPSRETIVSVFFLNTTNGWVLLADSNRAEDELQFDIASTRNAGVNWSVSHAKFPKYDPASFTFGDNVEIFFLDHLHGWMNVSRVSGAAFCLGVTLATEDGGLSWHGLANSPPVAGSIRFISPADGWLAGGPNDSQLYVTHDGQHWQEVSLEAPQQAYPAKDATYNLPTFEDSIHGYLPVTYSGRRGAKSAAVLFATADGGKTWHFDRILPNLEERSPGQKMASTIVDHYWIVATESLKGELTLTKVGPGGAGGEIIKSFVAGWQSVLQVGFANSTRGYMLTIGNGSNKRLLFTTDGGVTWMDKTPRKQRSEIDRSTAPPQEQKSFPYGVPLMVNDHELPIKGPIATSSAASSTTHISRHLGFDRSAYPTLDEMQIW